MISTEDVAGLMESQGVPAPQIMLVGAIAFLILGSLSIIVGFKARIGATLLLLFLVLATYFFHDSFPLAVFWRWFATLWSVSAQNTIRSRPIPQLVRNVPLPTRVGEDNTRGRLHRPA